MTELEYLFECWRQDRKLPATDPSQMSLKEAQMRYMMATECGLKGKKLDEAINKWKYGE
jgi:hypothetical protein